MAILNRYNCTANFGFRRGFKDGFSARPECPLLARMRGLRRPGSTYPMQAGTASVMSHNCASLARSARGGSLQFAARARRRDGFRLPAEPSILIGDSATLMRCAI